MPQTTIRFPEELLERIDESTGPETSRSEWLRNAARERLGDDRDEFDEYRDELELIDERITELERRVNRSPIDRLRRVLR